MILILIPLKIELSAFLEDVINSQIFLLNLKLKCKFSFVLNE